MNRLSALFVVSLGAFSLCCLAIMRMEGQAPSTPSSVSTPSRNTARNPMLPLWAYPVLPPQSRTSGVRDPRPAAARDDIPCHVSGSNRTFTTAYIADLFTVPDWFPDGHPPMPRPVRQGRRPDAAACAYCHLPNGLGRPENESIAGLPRAYIIEQLKDFKDGSRHSSERRMGSVNYMVRVAKAVRPDEIEAAADYFSRLKLTKWLRVVETETVPKTHISDGMLVVDATGTEPIGSRIIEVSEDYEQTELRNPRSGFVAYVPMGSLKAGERFVKTGGNGKTMACTTCHGADLRGLGNTPGIAGRSPSQMARQLIDFRSGARSGPGAVMMRPVVSNLTDDDIIAITAYLASLNP